jgi:Protein of unknown function (DUF4239)
MSLGVAVAVIIVSVPAGVGAALLLSRVSPDSGEPNDTTRVVFTFVSTAWALLVAFVVFLAFGNFAEIKSSASAEADAAKGVYLTALAFSRPTRDLLQHDIVCYGRSVVEDDFPAMWKGSASTSADLRVRRIRMDLNRARVAGTKQEAAYRQLLTQLDARSTARSDRLEEARPIVPPIMWVALGLGSAMILGYSYAFASRKRDRFLLVALSATPTAMVVSILVALIYFDSSGGEAVKPTAMERTLELTPRITPNPRATAPCDRVS